MRDKLTAVKVDRIKKPGRHADGGGLYLNVSPKGCKTWLFRYKRHGKSHWMALGSLDDYGLAEARDRAHASRKLLAASDPIAEKRVTQAQGIKVLTFEEASRQFLSTEIVAQFKNETHRKQWHSTLALAYDNLGPLPLQSIDSALVLQTLLPIMKRTPETGSRLRGRMERVFAWAKAHKLFDGENPASRDVLRDALPAKPKVKHHKAYPFKELPAFMGDLRKRDSMSARALEFAILTAARTGEVIGARWEEIDTLAKLWTIPADRMKAGKEHAVPLCDRAVEILTKLRKDCHGVTIFGNGKPLSNMAMSELLKGAAGNGYTVHGFRSSFRDWAGDATHYPRDVIEMALAHVVENKTEAAYRRGNALDKRRALMSEWCSYCASS
jgi:integrase